MTLKRNWNTPEVDMNPSKRSWNTPEGFNTPDSLDYNDSHILAINNTGTHSVY